MEDVVGGGKQSGGCIGRQRGRVTGSGRLGRRTAASRQRKERTAGSGRWEVEGAASGRSLEAENFPGWRKAGESGVGAWYAGSEKRALAGLCRERESDTCEGTVVIGAKGMGRGERPGGAAGDGNCRKKERPAWPWRNGDAPREFDEKEAAQAGGAVSQTAGIPWGAGAMWRMGGENGTRRKHG